MLEYTRCIAPLTNHASPAHQRVHVGCVRSTLQLASWCREESRVVASRRKKRVERRRNAENKKRGEAQKTGEEADSGKRLKRLSSAGDASLHPTHALARWLKATVVAVTAAVDEKMPTLGSLLCHDTQGHSSLGLSCVDGVRSLAIPDQ